MKNEPLPGRPTIEYRSQPKLICVSYLVVTDAPEFEGVWGVYPFYDSGLLVTANIDGDFFVLQSKVEEVTRCDDGLDNDSDGQADLADSGCESTDDQQE
jgi:hypothetical protein